MVVYQGAMFISNETNVGLIFIRCLKGAEEYTKIDIVAPRKSNG